MTIEIDLELLKTTDLTPNEFIGLYLTLRKGYSYIDELNLNIDWTKLETKGYIDCDNSLITDKFKKLFSNNFDAMFNELISIYPNRVQTSSTTRVLCAADPKAKTNLKAYKKYKLVVGKKLHVHNRIIKLLKVQLKLQEDNLGYMQNLETWINNHTWEKYENLNENDGRTSAKRTTRSL
tara:strand:- start:1364 stop:1900 length:537 start_codon:yes stop_codon:yes gene_type:complete